MIVKMMSMIISLLMMMMMMMILLFARSNVSPNDNVKIM